MCLYMVRGDASQRLPVYALERVKTRPYKIGRGYASKAGLRSDVAPAQLPPDFLKSPRTL
jgi:hypothetical protein